ncbi:response regulator transcription factor [Niastella caeni]|uniref:Response regulator transcription factor n=1 Tax=Niastella caeni TaxID=2569763 RepID=A0A4S8HS23_9BACT|nr:LytTR family DNA-binding domain-containing protein [Niastella caeni]THU38263.1 response regulator transcription factor [Niastella caeni]
MHPIPPLRIIIVEDLPGIRQDLEDFLRQQPGFTVIGACATVHEAIVLIHATKPDLLLLDINLPDGTGFDILEQMSPPHPKVIFLTAHAEHTIKAIRYGAIDYLLKPLNEKELTEALQRVISAQPLLQEQIAITLHSFRKNKLQDHLALRTQQFVQIVELKEICYLQVDNGCTTVYINGGKKLVTTRTLKDYEEQLSGASFLRTHKSYLVNELYIHRYHPKEGILCLKDGTQIPVSLRKKEMIGLYFKTLWALCTGSSS